MELINKKCHETIIHQNSKVLLLLAKIQTIYSVLKTLHTLPPSYLPNDLKVNLFLSSVSYRRKLTIEVGQWCRVGRFHYCSFPALTQTNNHLSSKVRPYICLLAVRLLGLKRRMMSYAPSKFLPPINLRKHLCSFRHPWCSPLPVQTIKFG